jgi:hypothetical protein
MKQLYFRLIRFYQNVFSDLFYVLFGKGCRFYPTCSEYSKAVVKRYGLSKGIYLSLKRISRCHPFGGFGLDPVPENFKP